MNGYWSLLLILITRELATLNEFREFFGMSRHTRFEDINGNVEIQDALRDLYNDPDLVELYPGLFCEGNGDWDAKKETGSGLDPGTSCPNGRGTALWRSVFSDAVTLVRSDRFYTIVGCSQGVRFMASGVLS